jgi:protein required for attachment to host cells
MRSENAFSVDLDQSRGTHNVSSIFPLHEAERSMATPNIARRQPLTWYVVLDAARGSVWARRGRRDLPVWMFDLVPAVESVADRDRSGRTQESATTARHRIEERVPPRRRRALAFADQVAALLDRAVAKNEVDGLVLVARDRMLGELRRALAPRTRARVVQETPSLLTRLTPASLARKLASVDHAPRAGESHVR